MLILLLPILVASLLVAVVCWRRSWEGGGPVLLIPVALATLTLASCAALPEPQSDAPLTPEFRVGISGPGAALEWSPGWLFGYGVGLKIYLVTPGGGEIAKPSNLFPEITK